MGFSKKYKKGHEIFEQLFLEAYDDPKEAIDDYTTANKIFMATPTLRAILFNAALEQALTILHNNFAAKQSHKKMEIIACLMGFLADSKFAYDHQKLFDFIEYVFSQTSPDNKHLCDAHKDPNFMPVFTIILQLIQNTSELSSCDTNELLIPTYGLDKEGKWQKTLGKNTAQICIKENQAKLIWKNPKTSAQIEKDFAVELNTINYAIVLINEMIKKQKKRIEDLFLLKRNWRFCNWYKLYIEHPIVSCISKKLIWRFSKDKTGIWHKEKFVDAHGNSLRVTKQTQVRLWHPIQSCSQTISNWRLWLQKNNIEQPFPQAHREVYRITSAELSSKIYSHRFAAHIIPKNTFRTLSKEMNWEYTYNKIVFSLPNDFVAEFWYDAIGEDETEMGKEIYLSTDQTCFYKLQKKQELAKVPKVFFSETMRNIDFLMRKSSLGNDPHWEPRDSGQRWHEYSFGELSQMALDRKELLKKILPRLKIANRCKISDQYLYVKGSLCVYKIHIGSAHVIMEHNNQYLCISEGRSQASSLLLPFTGDHTLAVILSKAFFLVEDTKIKDETISQQIRKTM